MESFELSDEVLYGKGNRRTRFGPPNKIQNVNTTSKTFNDIAAAKLVSILQNKYGIVDKQKLDDIYSETREVFQIRVMNMGFYAAAIYFLDIDGYSVEELRDPDSRAKILEDYLQLILQKPAKTKGKQAKVSKPSELEKFDLLPAADKAVRALRIYAELFRYIQAIIFHRQRVQAPQGN